jgi:hypothetical protein
MKEIFTFEPNVKLVKSNAEWDKGSVSDPQNNIKIENECRLKLDKL